MYKRFNLALIFLVYTLSSCTEEKKDFGLREYRYITGENDSYAKYLLSQEKSHSFYLPKLFTPLPINKRDNLEDSLTKYNNFMGFSFVWLEYKYSHYDTLSNRHTLYYSYIGDDLIEFDISSRDYKILNEKTKDFGKFYYFPLVKIKVNSHDMFNTDSTIINRIKGKFECLYYLNKK